VFSMIGDGLFMRRALDPNFDTDKLVPAAMSVIGRLLNAGAPAPQQTAEKKDRQ
jgi:TetR/AcrR family transcriptional repressor of uid operon